MEKRRLILSMIITGVVMVVEIVGGIMSNSLALLSDAGHMFTHLFALGISLGAIYIASRDPYNHRTYGLYRAEILAALFNSFKLFDGGIPQKGQCDEVICKFDYIPLQVI